MSDTTITITPEERQLLRSGGYGDYERLRLLNALEQAEARAEKAEEELADVYAELDEMADELTDYRGIESDLADAEREIEELRDELEDSRGTEKDAPNILCAIARLVGVYEHCQEIGDDMGDMTLDAVRELLADKQKAEAEVARLQQRVNELLSEELTDCAVRELIQLRFNMHEVLQQNTRLTKMVDWLAMHLSGYDAQKKCTVYPAEWKEAARRAVAAGEG